MTFQQLFLPKLSQEFSPVLAKLFQKCFLESCFPSSWKFPSVIPVFINCSERSHPRTQRPRSILPVISEVFEFIMNESLVQHFESNNFFCDSQYGFRAQSPYRLCIKLFSSMLSTTQRETPPNTDTVFRIRWSFTQCDDQNVCYMVRSLFKCLTLHCTMSTKW